MVIYVSAFTFQVLSCLQMWMKAMLLTWLYKTWMLKIAYHRAGRGFLNGVQNVNSVFL